MFMYVYVYTYTHIIALLNISIYQDCRTILLIYFQKIRKRYHKQLLLFIKISISRELIVITKICSHYSIHIICILYGLVSFISHRDNNKLAEYGK
jgi:hypothetical protein